MPENTGMNWYHDLPAGPHCDYFTQDYISPETYKDRTGKSWPEHWAVYVKYESNNYWNISCYEYARFRKDSKGHRVIIICATDGGMPPDKYQPEDSKDKPRYVFVTAKEKRDCRECDLWSQELRMCEGNDVRKKSCRENGFGVWKNVLNVEPDPGSFGDHFYRYEGYCGKREQRCDNCFNREKRDGSCKLIALVTEQTLWDEYMNLVALQIKISGKGTGFEKKDSNREKVWDWKRRADQARLADGMHMGKEFENWFFKCKGRNFSICEYADGWLELRWG
jgi:hypothetical protein